ncbi:MAG: hypothetical protein OEX03_02640 [Gammaproteobacteria bacterium]|nr:hypothetical protein [Gammaproteobacteria bacterium]
MSITLNNQSRNILLLGYGEMGHAFEVLLADRHQVSIWSRRREQQGHCNLEEEVTAAEMIIFCLPVMAHASVIARLVKSIRKDTLCITIAKGLDETGSTAVQILQRGLIEQPVAGIYGPMIAEELIAHRPGFAQLASTDESLYAYLADCFHNSHLYLEPGNDLAGSSWCVILKNVYALLLGMADGLQLGDNMRGYLMVKSLEELSAIVESLGGNSHTPFQLPGLGDLITTATSINSHHHSLGLAIGEGKEVELSGEGIHTLRMVVQHQPFDYARYPLFSLCVVIVDDTENCGEYFSAYLGTTV